MNYTPLTSLPPVSRDPSDILRLFGPGSEGIQRKIRSLLHTDRPVLGDDLEFDTPERYVEVPTILGLSDGHLSVSVPYNDGLPYFKQLCERNPNILYVGHSFLSADLFAFRNAGINIDPVDVHDTIIWHYLTALNLCKGSGKLQDEDGEKRGRGYMNLWAFISLHTSLPNWKECKKAECDGTYCYEHEPYGYNGVDAIAPVLALPSVITQARLRGVDKLYPLHRSLAYVLTEMSKYGVQVDRDYVSTLSAEFDKDKAAIESRLPFNIRSNPQSIAYFKEKGIKLADWREATIREVCEEEDDEELTLALEWKEMGNGTSRWFDPIHRNTKGEWVGYLDSNGKVHPRLGIFTSTGRFNCVTKGTPIEILRDVKKYPKGIPIEDVKKGDWAYCFTTDGKLTLRQVLWAGKTGNQKVVRLHWKARHSQRRGRLDLTADHLVRCSNGEFKAVSSLQPGDTITALSRGINSHGYAVLYPTGYPSHKAIPEHRFVFSTTHDYEPQCVHHVDHNKLHNTIANLEGMTNAEHLNLHREGFQERISEGLRRIWKENREEYLTRCIPRGEKHGAWLGLTKEWMMNALVKHEGPTRAARAYGIDFMTFKKYMDINGIEWDRKGKQVIYSNNHIVEFVEELNTFVDVYDLTVQDTHNFIANEICVHNCVSPNLQNVSKRRLDRHVCQCGARKEEHPTAGCQVFKGQSLGKKVRRAIVATPGWYLLKADYSNAENRMFLYLSGHRIPEGKDLHQWVAGEMGLTPEMEFCIKESSPREAAKTAQHGSMYLEGIQLKYPSELKKGVVKKEIEAGVRDVWPQWTFNKKVVTFTGSNLAQRAFGSKSWENRLKAHTILKALFGAFPGARRLQQRIGEQIEKERAVITPHGYYLASFGQDEERMKTGAAMWGSNPIAHLTKLALVRLWNDFVGGRPMRPVLQVHDEIVCEVRNDVAPDVAAGWLKGAMEIETPEIPGLIVPTDAAFGTNWRDTSKVVAQ